jgi:GT2 family glycosyltransferase
MLISVVVPTCHRDELLSQCLERLAPGAQTLAAERYEVIVTDDGRHSTAEAMLRDRFAWAKWVPGPQKGPAANRNNGARHAQGQWIAFTDDDCLPQRTWLQAFAGAIVPDICVYEGRTTCLAGLKSPLEHAPINLNGGWLWSCNFAIAKSAFDQIGGFDESYRFAHMEDADLRERLRAGGMKMQFVPDAMVDHPPRRQSSGRSLGLTHECDVVFARKWKRPCTRVNLLFNTLRCRLQAIRRHRFSADVPHAVCSTVGELATIAFLYPRWDGYARDVTGD